MPQKTVWLPEIGELTLAKRRGSRNIRLSVSASGRIRVGLPAWAPYAAGIKFALSRKEWLLEHKAQHQPIRLKAGDRIGKSHRLRFELDESRAGISTRIKNGVILIKGNSPLSDDAVQNRAKTAAERALRKEAEHLLLVRLSELAVRYDFKFRSAKIKKMTSRWGSCSSSQMITLNYFLMQLPWQLIDYVLLHELVHTRHLDHSPAFWSHFESVYPGAKQARKLIRDYKPIINAVSADMS